MGAKNLKNYFASQLPKLAGNFTPLIQVWYTVRTWILLEKRSNNNFATHQLNVDFV